LKKEQRQCQKEEKKINDKELEAAVLAALLEEEEAKLEKEKDERSLSR
jgi:hypothetical protein